MKITGQVVFIELSGGFWGIRSQEGAEYFPVNGLPDRFKKEGLAIEVEALPSSLFSIYMWGIPVEISHIKRSKSPA